MRTPIRAIALLLIALVASAACTAADPSGSAPGGAPVRLAGTSWIVLTVGGRSPVAGAVPTISFTADAVSGTGGCNHVGGRYQLDPATGRLAFGDLAMTAMGCLQAGVSDFETFFLRALGGATQAAIDPTGQLVLDGARGRIVLVTLEHPTVPS